LIPGVDFGENTRGRLTASIGAEDMEVQKGNLMKMAQSLQVEE
jgi:hypothetical protein